MSRIGPYGRERWTADALDRAVRYLAQHNGHACLSMNDFTRCALSVLHREAAGRTLRNRLLAAGRIERKVTRGCASCYVLLPSSLRR